MIALVALLAGAVWLYTRPGTAATLAAWLDSAGDAMSGADRNERAFLAMIGQAEGADYYTLFGGQFFLEIDTHPAVRSYGEFLTPGVQDFTTAAGKYQITFTTWKKLAARLGLTDFSAPTQDAMALELIRERGALELVRAGRFDEAVRLVAPVWASLPGNGAPQRHRTPEYVRQAYVNAGGALA